MQAIKDFLMSNRIKSLLWRSGMMFLAGFISILSDSLAGFELSPQITVFLGLVLGEISKAINGMLAKQ